MMRSVRKLWSKTDGTVAPIVALSLTGLVAAGGLAFDYAHLAALHTEVQDGADQAALAAASQLDGQLGACARAAAAAANMLNNNALFANAGANRRISVTEESTCDGTGKIQFYQSYNQVTDTPGAVATTDAQAKVVLVQVDAKRAAYALTPIVNAFTSGDISGTAIASVGSAICKTPPVMLCNPSEPSGNTDENLPFTPSRGVGLKLITGDASAPGNFGWLQASNGPGASNLAENLGYNTPPGDCQPGDAVTTKTGLDKSVLKAFNTRFDIYANGNQTCPHQDGGTCSPSDVTRKDLVCGTSGGNPTACSSADGWGEASKPYQLPQSCTSGKKPVCTSTVADLPIDKSQDPSIMGYPPDECHMGPTTGACGVTGDGRWDRDAFFRVNFDWDHATWQSQTGLGDTATRYDVYKWERANHNPNGKGIGIAQKDTGNNYAFGIPATGHASAPPAISQADRRVMAVAVLNCQALNLHGHRSNVAVASWMDVFLVMPAVSRAQFSDSNIYVEEIGPTSVSADDTTAQVVRRDKPYLIK